MNVNIVQVKLVTKDKRQMTTWVDQHPDLKEGCVISLKDYEPNTMWLVEKVYKGVHDSHAFDFHRKWDNNNYDKHHGSVITK